MNELLWFSLGTANTLFLWWTLPKVYRLGRNRGQRNPQDWSALRLYQRPNPLNQPVNSAPTNSGKSFASLAGRKNSGKLRDEWWVAKATLDPERWGIRAGQSAYSNSTLRPGSDMPEKTPNSGPTPSSTPARPTPRTSTTSGGGNQPGPSGRVNQGGDARD